MYMNAVFVFLWLAILGCESFDFKIYPKCSQEKPLFRKYFEIVPREQDLPFDSKFKIDRFSSNSSASLLDSVVVPLRAPFVTLYDYSTIYRGHWWNESETYGPQFIKVSLLDSEENVVTEAGENDFLPLFWDYRYFYLEWNDFVSTKGRPGQIWVDPIPDDEELAKQTAIYWWSSRTADRSLSPQKGSYNWVSNNKTLRWIFEKPGVIYFTLRGYNGYDSGHTAAGLSTYRYSGLIALQCCFEDGSCPPIDPTFTGPVFQAEPIPGDIQFPIVRHRVTVIESTNWGLALHSLPNFIDVELPVEFGFADWFHNLDRKNSMESLSTTIFQGTNAYRFNLETTQWGYMNRVLNIALEFNEGVVLGNEYPMHVRIENGDWQTIILVPKASFKVPINETKQLLLLSDTWGGLGSYKSMDDYLNLGFNVIPKAGFQYGDWEDWSVDVRANWTSRPKYGPEASLLHMNRLSADPPVYGLYSTLEMDNVDPTYLDDFSLSTDERNEELEKWQNAIDFFIAQGDYYPMPDPCYDGIFFKRQLEYFGEFLEATKPETLNFDIEGWGSYGRLLADDLIGTSQNCLNRKLSGETNEQMYWRIVDKMIGDIKNVFDEKSPETESITWYGLKSVNNVGYQLAKFETYEKYEISPQPSCYWSNKNSDIYAEIMRNNKLYLIGNTNENRLFVPMPSWATYGYHQPYQTFNYMIHTFSGGATGVQFYNPHRPLDLEHMLMINEAFSIFVPYEEVIVNGKLAFHDFEFENCLISAIKNVENVYLISVTSHQLGQQGFTDCNITLDTRLLNKEKTKYMKTLSVENLRKSVEVEIQTKFVAGYLEILIPRSDSSIVLKISQIDYNMLAINLAVGVSISSIFLIVLAVIVVTIIVCAICTARKTKSSEKFVDMEETKKSDIQEV